MSSPTQIPLEGYRPFSEEEMKKRAKDFRLEMQRRRSVRQFSSKPVPMEVIQDCLLTAGSAPSGANRQPWHFVVITDPAIKKKIRSTSEKEEYRFYNEDQNENWLRVLEPLGTGADKPFLETAPVLIAIFAEKWVMDDEGIKEKNYYVRESVGIAIGMLVTAIHHAGLVSLTYTVPRMGFLNSLVGRGANESPMMILVVGYPDPEARVPKIKKKSLTEISTFR
ncbi:MAG: nitroreductase family protein [Calditrichales bacterium]|nr:MAG: nitroreductase family protein [Calditrichales bacterium]